MATFDQFGDTDRRSLTDAERVGPTLDEAPSRVALIASGILPSLFAIQLVGSLSGQLPIDGSVESRLFFGVVMLVGLAASIVEFVSLHRRARRARHDDTPTEHPPL